jgi:hypothetical protein
MISPFVINKTIKSLHAKYNLDFHDLNANTYASFLTLLSNNEQALNDFKIYATYSRGMNVFNSHISSYLDQFIIEAEKNNDFQSIIDLDNLLYDDDYILISNDECVLSAALNHTSSSLQPNAYAKHFYRKYYTFDKFKYNITNNMVQGVEKNAEYIVDDILSGSLTCFSAKDTQGLKELIYNHFHEFKLVDKATIYMMNSKALHGDYAYKRSIHLFYDLMSEGIISCDMAALIISYGDDQLFEVMLDTLDEAMMRAIFRDAAVLIENFKGRNSINNNLNQRIEAVFEKWTQAVLKQVDDVKQIGKILGYSSLASIKHDEYRHQLLNCVSRIGPKSEETLKIVLDDYELSDPGKIALDMRHCPGLAALRHQLPSSVRRELLDADLSL